MEKLTCITDLGKSEIFLGQKWTSVWDLINREKSVIITDSNVNALYGDHFQKMPVIVIEAGEESKRIELIERILNELLQLKADRSTFILGIGGGVVTDIAGFVASIYMRGVRFGFVSSTLLSQVDASIGGKNGVNLGGIKNIVGTITLPEFVICDPEMLLTLSEREFKSGLCEVVKHALIKSADMLGYIEENVDKILSRNMEVMEKLISSAVKIKADIVRDDVSEKGERRLLNFGHTAGHALEVLTDLPHGYAIAHGMIIACQLSVEERLLDPIELSRISTLFSRLGVLSPIDIDGKDIARLIMNDKKREEDSIHFVFLRRAGEAVVKRVPLSEISIRFSEIDFTLESIN